MFNFYVTICFCIFRYPQWNNLNNFGRGPLDVALNEPFDLETSDLLQDVDLRVNKHLSTSAFSSVSSDQYGKGNFLEQIHAEMSRHIDEKYE